MVVIEARVMDSTHLELAQPIAAPTGAKVVVSLVDPACEGKDHKEEGESHETALAPFARNYNIMPLVDRDSRRLSGPVCRPLAEWREGSLGRD